MSEQIPEEEMPPWGPTSYAAVIVFWTLVLSCLPPSAFKMRSPPETGIVPWWYLRFFTAQSLVAFNVYTFVVCNRNRAKGTGCFLVGQLVVCAWAFLIMWGLLGWVDEAPCWFQPVVQFLKFISLNRYTSPYAC